MFTSVCTFVFSISFQQSLPFILPLFCRNMPKRVAKRKAQEVEKVDLSESEEESTKPTSSKKKKPSTSNHSTRSKATKKSEPPKKAPAASKKKVKSAEAAPVSVGNAIFYHTLASLKSKSGGKAKSIATSSKKAKVEHVDLSSEESTDDDANLVGDFDAAYPIHAVMSQFNFHTGESNWDPRRSADWDKAQPTAMCKKRMQHDLANTLAEEEALQIYIQPNEQDITKLTAVVVGPSDTPYEGKFNIVRIQQFGA